MEHRRFPHFFVQQVLPQLFYPDPQRFFAQVDEEALRGVWLDGNRQLGEKTPPDGLRPEWVDWGAGRACLLRLPRPLYAGEAFAALLVTPNPALLTLEKMEEGGFALSGVSADGVHTFYQTLPGSDPSQFVSRCREKFL